MTNPAKVQGFFIVGALGLKTDEDIGGLIRHAYFDPPKAKLLSQIFWAKATPNTHLIL